MRVSRFKTMKLANRLTIIYRHISVHKVTQSKPISPSKHLRTQSKQQKHDHVEYLQS